MAREPPSPLASLDPGSGQMFGKYELVERLGHGGMAEVWKAKIRGIAGFERTLVIKRVLAHLAEDEDFVRMFVREAQLCSLLNHPNIVQVYELGEIDGEYYIAMEYVRGKDLYMVMRAFESEPPPPGLAAFIGRDVARALAYANQLPGENGDPLRLVHRDVTPSNLMLTFEGTLKLVDFGVAKAMAGASQYLTVGGAIKGKLAYMAPEQLKGGNVDHRCDLFAVGATLHEVLTGRRLFKGDNDHETINNVFRATVPEPSSINPRVPRSLERVVMKALERDPAKRWQSGHELAEALEACVFELKWGSTQTAALLREAFGDVESLPPGTKPPGKFLAAATELGYAERRNSPRPVPAALSVPDVVLPPLTGSRTQHEEATPKPRPASFVHSVAEMGTWTGSVPLDPHELSSLSGLTPLPPGDLSVDPIAETALAPNPLAISEAMRSMSSVTGQSRLYTPPPFPSEVTEQRTWPPQEPDQTQPGMRSRKLAIGGAILVFLIALVSLVVKTAGKPPKEKELVVELPPLRSSEPVVTPLAPEPRSLAAAQPEAPRSLVPDPPRPAPPRPTPPAPRPIVRAPSPPPRQPPVRHVAVRPKPAPAPAPTARPQKSDLKRGDTFDPFR